MKYFFKKLPSPATDCTGAYSVGYEMNGIVVLHDPGGCMGHCLMVDEYRSIFDMRTCYTAALREYDTVVGSDSKVIEKVTNAIDACDCKFAMLIGTPVSMVVGADLPALARVIERKTGVPTIGVQTDCFHTYESGQSKAYLAFMNRFVKDDVAPSSKALVNILGATPLDMWDLTSLDDIENYFYSEGFDDVHVWGFSEPNRLENAGAAKLNVVVSISGLAVAKELKKKFGTPYVVGFPIGKKQIEAYTSKVHAPDSSSEPSENSAEPSAFKKVLIIGEQVRSNAYRDCLRNEYGVRDVNVVSFFDMAEELSEAGDKHLLDEDEFTNYYAENGPYDLVFGDMMYDPLVDLEKTHFVRTPHIAASCAFAGDEASNCIGEKGTQYFDELFERLNSLQ